MGVEKQFISNLKHLRKVNGISQERLANQIDMSPSYFRKIEHGLSSPSLKSMECIAIGLGTTVSALVSESSGNEDTCNEDTRRSNVSIPESTNC